MYIILLKMWIIFLFKFLLNWMRDLFFKIYLLLFMLINQSVGIKLIFTGQYNVLFILHFLQRCLVCRICNDKFDKLNNN